MTQTFTKLLPKAWDRPLLPKPQTKLIKPMYIGTLQKNEFEATALPSFWLERAWKNIENTFFIFFSTMKIEDVMTFLMGGIKWAIVYIYHNDILLRTHGPYHRHKNTKSG